MNPPSFPLYTQAIRFEVAVALDGVTPSPPLDQPPATGAEYDPETGELVIQVDRLGLVNLTGAVGSIGDNADRFIKSIRVYGPNTPLNANNVGLFFNDAGERRIELAIPAGANGIYSTNCIFVPQDAQLYLNGMLADALSGEPVIVRLEVWRPQSVADLVAIQRTCCCNAGCVDELGNPCFTQALYTAEACARTIISVDPDTVVQNSGANVIAVTGSGFTTGDIWAIVNTDEGATLTITDVTVNSDTDVDLTVEVPFDATIGSYDLVVAAPLGGPDCTATLEGAITVDPE